MSQPERGDYYLDITEEVCPITFVKTKLMIERVEVGAVVRVRLKGDEPLHNVPRSVEELGHQILSCAPDLSDPGGESHILLIRKAW